MNSIFLTSDYSEGPRSTRNNSIESKSVGKFGVVIALVLVLGMIFTNPLLPVVAGGYFRDTTDEDFAKGTHENTENVDDHVQLENVDGTFENQGRFTSRVFDAKEVVRWENIEWSENLRKIRPEWAVENRSDWVQGDWENTLITPYYPSADDIRILAENARGRWNFDENFNAQNELEDLTSYKNNASQDNAARKPIFTDGKFDNAFNFDGVNDSVEASDDSSLDITDEITVEAWVQSQSENTTYNWITDTEDQWNEGTFENTAASGGKLALSGRMGVYETGVIPNVNGWTEVNLDVSYSNPVVVVTGQEGADRSDAAEESRPIITNLTSDSFEVRVLDDTETVVTENVGYIVMEYGHHTIDGVEVEAGTYTVSDQGTQTINYQEIFPSGSDTVVVDTIQESTPNAVSSRYSDGSIDRNGFDIYWEDFDCDDGTEDGWDCGTVTAGYIAVERGNPSSTFESGEEIDQSSDKGAGTWTQVNFNNTYAERPILFTNPQSAAGSDKSVMGRSDLSKTGVKIRNVEVDCSAVDTEQNHADSVDYVWIVWKDVNNGYENGRYFSRIFDAGTEVYWESATISATVPENTSYSISYAENSSGVWTYHDNISEVPDSRYLKFKVTMNTDGENTPELDNVNISYQTDEIHWITDPESEWKEGSFENTTTAEGKLVLEEGQLKTDFGYFRVPSSPGDENITGLGFEPDYIEFHITATNEQFDTETTFGGEEYGWGHGEALCKGYQNPCRQQAQSIAGGSSSINEHDAAGSENYAILQVITDAQGDAFQGFVKGKVTNTHSEGFNVQFDEVEQQEYVTYHAYKFPEGADVTVGSIQTPSSTGNRHVDVGFKPNYIRIITSNTIDSLDNFHRGIGDTGTDTDSTFGFSCGLGTENGGVINQRVMSVSASSHNINGHASAAYDNEIIRTLFTDQDGGIDGRITASLNGVDSNGFTLNFHELYSGTYSQYDNYPITFIAINTTSAIKPSIGHLQTPTSTGKENISIKTPTSGLQFIGANTIPSMNSEQSIGPNVNDGHYGWGFGAAENESKESSIGYSTHSNSVNGHASFSSDNSSLYILYTDRDGNVLGRDRGNIVKIYESDNVEIDWTDITTSSTTNVRYDTDIFLYQSFSPTGDYLSKGSYDSKIFDAGQVADWENSKISVTVPGGTSYSISYAENSSGVWTYHDNISEVPDSRYLKFRVIMNTDGENTPEIDEVNIWGDPGKILEKGNAFSLYATADVVFARVKNNLITAKVTGGWSHLTLTYDRDSSSDQQKLYVDGVLQAQENLSGPITTNSENLRIGYLFDGPIDEPMLFARALSWEEVHMVWDQEGARTDIKNGEWHSPWHDFDESAHIDNISTSADKMASPNENIEAVVSVNDNPTLDGTEDNTIITVGNGTNTYQIDTDGRYVRVRLNLETENTVHTPKVENYAICVETPMLDITFQVRSDNDNSDWGSFVGPDGTSNTYFTDYPGSLENISPNRYFQYRAYLSTEDNTLTPKLYDVMISYSQILGTPGEPTRHRCFDITFEQPSEDNGNLFLIRPAEGYHGGLWIQVEAVQRRRMNENYYFFTENIGIYQATTATEWDNNSNWRGPIQTRKLTKMGPPASFQIPSENVDYNRPLVATVENWYYRTKDGSFPKILHIVSVEEADY